MVRKIWEALADVRLTFWLLMAIAAIMLIGSACSLLDFQFIDSLNETTVQYWFMTRGVHRIGMSWWIVLLFLCFALFGANLVACTAQRCAALIRVRSNYGSIRFFTLLCPTLIHMAFLLVLIGHFITFTAATHSRMPVRPGEEIALPDGTRVMVAGIKHEFFPDRSLLRGRVSQTEVALSWKDAGKAVNGTVRFMDSLSINGQTVSLDMKRGRSKEGAGGASVKPKEKEFDKETCNKEQAYHLAHYRNTQTPELFILVTRDPGLNLLVPSFVVMSLLFVYYYAASGVMKSNTV